LRRRRRKANSEAPAGGRRYVKSRGKFKEAPAGVRKIGGAILVWATWAGLRPAPTDDRGCNSVAGDLICAAGTAGFCVFRDDLRSWLRRGIWHVGHCSIAGSGEFGPVALRDWIGGGQGEALEIQKLAVLLNAEIEMGASCEARHADEADALALLDVLAGADEDSR